MLEPGYACICIGDNNRMKDIRLAGATPEKLHEIYSHNLGVLRSTMLYNIRYGIRLFRISSDIFPLITHEDVDYDWETAFGEALGEISALAQKGGIRLSMHPGQYTVLNSLNDEVARRAVKEIDHHSEFLSRVTPDPYAPVIIHASSAGGDPGLAVSAFRKNFARLSENSRRRLCVEHDEKAMSAADIYALASEIQAPCIFDSLHNSVKPSFDLSDGEIISLFSKTFSGRRQKIHYSQQAPGKRAGAHSQTIDHLEFLRYAGDIGYPDLDVMLEVKDKDLSCVKCANCLRGNTSGIHEEWARYKYFVMERDVKRYREISAMFAGGGVTYPSFYSSLSDVLSTKPEKGGEVNALMHVWGYFKDRAEPAEKKRYLEYAEKLKNGRSAASAKAFLLSLAIKYGSEYLQRSIYFQSGVYDEKE